MIREILRMGDPRLLRVAPPVPPAMIGSPDLDALIADMFDTMRDAGGVDGTDVPVCSTVGGVSGTGDCLTIFGFLNGLRSCADGSRSCEKSGCCGCSTAVGFFSKSD